MTSLVPVVIDNICMTHHKFAVFASSNFGLPNDFLLISGIFGYGFNVYRQSAHVPWWFNIHVLAGFVFNI
jgi:hypothetical protein